MIDSLYLFLDSARALDMPQRFGLERKGYGVATLHRPSNVDDPDRLQALLRVLVETSQHLPIVFPIHPRTRKQLPRFPAEGRVQFCDPLGYLEFLGLMEAALAVITDSGGIQEETTALGIPCLTLRTNTERPITVETGTNTLLGDAIELVLPMVLQIRDGKYRQGTSPKLWDGQTSRRIVAMLGEKAVASL
jgi:UDP-N-acetylglucosamine 2-epimerase (non-hydrolysing)